MPNSNSNEFQHSLAIFSSNVSNNDNVNCSDILSLAWELAETDYAWTLPGPSAVPQDVQVDSGFYELSHLTQDSSKASPTIVDISGPSDSFGRNKAMTFYSGTDSTKEPTRVYQCSGFTDLQFRPPATQRQPEKKKSLQTDNSTPSEVITAHVQLPSNNDLPVVIKLSQQIKFLVSRVKLSVDESTKLEKKELVEYEFITDSMQFSSTSEL